MPERHSFQPREPQDESKKPVHGVSHHHAIHLNKDLPEDLATKIMDFGSEYIESKTKAKYTEDELAQGVSAVAAGPNPKDLANKIIKEGARELERQEGNVAAGGVAAMAQQVAHHRNDPSAPEYQVAKKIREKIAAEEERADHHTFQGPNPEKGKDPDHGKMRHLLSHGQPYVTGGFKNERNPDVSEPRK